MRLAIPLVLPLVLSIGGCMTPPEELTARDRATCARIGYHPGTDAFTTCLLELEKARRAGHHHGY